MEYTDVGAQAAALVERLDDTYREYLKNEQQQSAKGITRLFRRWFTGFNPLVAEPLNQQFIDDVADITVKLASELEQLKPRDAALCGAYAAKAVKIMLEPKPDGEKTTAQWYLTIAEYQSAPVLPYLDAADLKRIRDSQIKSTPKRLMYPKQRELFELIEKLLEEKQKRN